MLSFLSHYLASSVNEGPQRTTLVFLALSVATILVSIFISQIFLVAALVGSLWILVREDRVLSRWPPIGWPLLLFFCWTVMAALASSDIPRGLTILKKFFIFSLVFLVPLLARGQGRTIWIYYVIFIAASASSLMGLGQFIVDPRRDLLHRISGFMGQWMTYSGLQMLVLVALSAYALSNGLWRRWWVIPLGLLLGTSLILSETRNAWLGSVAGVAVVLWFRRTRALVGLLVLLAALFLIGPASMRQRLLAGWDTGDATTQGRIELLRTSLRLIRDNPLFGVGPKNVSTEALRYRGSYEFPDWLYQHMHNNFLQIAAERGIPGLLLWLWFMGRLAWDAYRVFRWSSNGHAPPATKSPESEALVASTSALGAWAALMVSGMFEYNFGDSEVLTLFLFIMSSPYAASNNHQDTKPQTVGSRQ